MNSKKKNIEGQIVEDFEKISPAITRLLQTQMKNDDLSLRYGRSKSNSKNDIVINPSILVILVELYSLTIPDTSNSKVPILILFVSITIGTE